MAGRYKIEPRGLSRDSVNQLNKIFDAIEKDIGGKTPTTALSSRQRMIAANAPTPSGPVNLGGSVPSSTENITEVNRGGGSVGPVGPPGPAGGLSSVAVDGTTIGGDGNGTPLFLETPVTVANGGTGTATPALVAGPNITISGSWPDNTIAGNLVNVTNAISTPYGVATTDYFIAGNSTASADQIINLPPASGTGRVLILKKIDSNAHNVVVTAAGSDKIDGSGTITLSSQYQAVTIVDMGFGVWSAIGAYP